jgi:hypothetical protein
MLEKVVDSVILRCVIRLLAVKEQELYNKFQFRWIVALFRDSKRYVRFQVLTAASMKLRIVFWDVLPRRRVK